MLLACSEVAVEGALVGAVSVKDTIRGMEEVLVGAIVVVGGVIGAMDGALVGALVDGAKEGTLVGAMVVGDFVGAIAGALVPVIVVDSRDDKTQ
jgi:hypothetical protein